MTELNTSEKILLHVEAMFRESCKEEMKVLKKIDEKKYMEYFINRYTDLHNNYPALVPAFSPEGRTPAYFFLWC